mgnify:CR=1 FL=1
MKAPVIGGVRIPTGNGQTVRLRQGASLADLAEKINVNPAALVTVLFHLGEMATATQSLDESTFQILGEEIGWNIQIVSAEEEDKELLQQFDIDLDSEELQEDEDLKPRPPVAPSWAMSTTVRPDCSTPSARPTSSPASRRHHPAPSAPIR